MKFHELPAEIFSIRVASTDGSSMEQHLAPQQFIDVIRVLSSEVAGVFDLVLCDSMLSVRPIRGADSIRLNQELTRGRSLLAQLSDPASDRSVELSIAFFFGETIDMGEVELGLDELAEDSAKKINNNLSTNKIYSWMTNQCMFSHGGETYFFLSAGPAITEELEAFEREQEAAFHQSKRGEGGEDAGGAEDAEQNVREQAFVHRARASLRSSFCVTGNKLRFVATIATLPGGASIYIIKKLTALRQVSDRTIRLAKGNLKFSSWTKAGQIQLLARAQLSVLTADESSYLKKWDEFGDLEGELLLSAARAIGVLQFSNPRSHKDGTVDILINEAIPSAIEALKGERLEGLEIVEDIPSYISDPKMSFDQFATALEADDSEKGRVREHFKVVRYDSETKILTLEAETIRASGKLIMSMVGHMAQVTRRRHARRQILEGRSANPQLGLLIEEKGEPTSLRSPQVIKPLTAFVRNKIFKNPPTYKQERAIEVALNTPDIALIQGPPGTGKTTVIAAILERLNEIATAAGTRGPGQVLLSGFQHDAVENMIDRISINGLPVPKFGKRSGSTEEELTAFERSLEEWCSKIAQELKAKNPQLMELKDEIAIKDIYKHYLQNPSRQLMKALLEAVEAVGVATLGEELANRAAALTARLIIEDKSQQDQYLLAIQRIRTRPESFADDGPARAEEALIDLEDILGEAQSALLNRAAAWSTGRGVPPLAELAQMKRELSARFTAPPVFRVEKHNDEVLRLVDDVLEQIRRSGLTSKDRKAVVLIEFLTELESNPTGMIDAISDFSYAFSATAQQSVNRQMQRRKGIKERRDFSNAGQRELEYEYVIIDEAARVSPRDLMIPMSQGKKIILVGDHRQLPHIIEEEVARRMEEGADSSDDDGWLKKSMFQYLFSERLRVLEERDGIQRRVTLDKQFRMHPDLGSFVSRNFYERFDVDERFESGLPAVDFSHNLPDTNNKPAIWLPVPAKLGFAKRSGTSWTREAEVDAITCQLKLWLESPQGRNLSYGVISYYKAQSNLIVNKIKREIKDLDLDGKKIRVGTVDSFQGMEFDVVFLSVVRTLPQNEVQWDGERSRQANRIFGRLCLYNLLNVSMSRQKKLLVVVGDPDIVAHDLAKEFIPGLVDFHALATTSLSHESIRR